MSTLDSPAPINAGDVDRPVLRLWREAVAASKRQCQARRARVLAYPDLAQRLTDPPLRLSSLERWSGWIPPRALAEEACSSCGSGGHRPVCSDRPHRCRVNTSPVRRQLVAIASEALRRERTGTS